jgi:hypothetical protein
VTNQEINMRDAVTELGEAALAVEPEKLPSFRRMTWDNELACLTALTRNFYEGVGEIVDGGAFTGASAYALAAGLADNLASRSCRIHSYDTFIATDYSAKMLGEGVSAGEHFLHIFEQNVRRYRHLINVYPGDITGYRWIGRPIEVLFCDVAKTPSLNTFLISEFFPHLVPGSVIIYQDFVFGGCPWHHWDIGALSPYLELIHVAAPSAIFRVTGAIPPELLVHMTQACYSPKDKLALLDIAAKMLTGDSKKMVLVTKCKVLLNSGELGEAEQLYTDDLCEGFEIKRFNRYLQPLADRLYKDVAT